MKSRNLSLIKIVVSETGLKIKLLLPLVFAGLFFAFPSFAEAAGCSGTGSCYWVGGTGNWSDTAHWATASGGATTGGLPTAADNVHFDAGSNTTNAAYTMTVDTAAVMNDLNFSAMPGDGLGGTITWAGSQAMTISGSMLLLSGMTRTYTGDITFNATTTGKTIMTNGVTLNGSAQDVIFNGAGGEWTLQDDATLSGNGAALSVTNGTFDTNNKTLTANSLNHSSGTATISLGASIVDVNTQVTFTGGGLTLNAGTSSITFNNVFNGGGLTFYDVTSNGASLSSVSSANTFHNLTLAPPALRTVIINADQTVNGTLTLTSNSVVTRTLIKPTINGTPITITAAVVSLTDVDFQDITFANSTSPGTHFTGTRLGDALGNGGDITFATGVPKYYVGNTGNWNGAVWATSSGGAADANNFPLPQDTAIFDNNSFSANSQTVTINGVFRVPSIDFSAMTNRTGITFATGSNTTTLYGDLKLTTAGGFALSGTGTLNFSGRSTQTITSYGISWTRALIINSIGGTVRLADDFTTDTTRTVTLSNGTLNLNGKTLSTGLFSSSNSNTRSITSGGGGITLTGTGTVWSMATATNFVLNDPLTVTTNDGSATARTITSGTTGGTETNSPSFSITAGTGNVTITSSSSIKNLDFTGFAGNLTGNSRTIYGNLTLAGTMTLTSTTLGTTFAATSGTQTITTNGNTLDFPITVNAPGATVQLADALSLGSTRTLTLTNGTFDANNQNVTTGLFSSSNSNTRAITMGSGTWTLTGAGTVWNAGTATNLTVTPGTSTVKVTDASATTKTFAGGSKTYNNIWLSGAGTGAFNFTGSNTFNDFKADTPPHTILFTAGTTTTVSSWNVRGTAGNLMMIGSVTAASHTLVKISGGTFSSDYVSVSYSDATPGATWYAGSNSTNGGNNSGWIFTDPPAAVQFKSGGFQFKSGGFQLR
jgi:hypothetical protein